MPQNRRDHEELAEQSVQVAEVAQLLANQQVVYTPRWAVPVLPHVRIHMLSPKGPSKLGKVEAGSLQSLRIHLPKGGPGCQTQETPTGTSPTRPLASG